MVCSNTSVLMSPEVAVQRPWREVFREPYFRANLVLVAIDERHTTRDYRMLYCTLGDKHFAQYLLDWEICEQ